MTDTTNNGYGFWKESGEPVTEDESRELFDEMLNDLYEEITFTNSSYTPSDVLSSVDPIAYDEEMRNYIDNMCQDGDTIVYNYEDTDAYMEDEDEDG